MAIYKNTASQKLAVYAYDPTTTAGTDPSTTGDAANITAQISKDGAASAATNDVNPTELDSTDHPGIYIFDLTQAETNADLIVVTPVSSTSNVLLDVVSIYTAPEEFKLGSSQIVIGAAAAGTLSVTQMTTDLTESTDDHYNGRTIIWTSGALAGQARSITDYSGTNGLLTFDTATEAPSASDEFIIV